MNNPPLQGIKVIELGTILAVPLVGTFLAELGAEVIKIEPPTKDPTINWKLPNENNNISAYYRSANHGKKILYKKLSNNSHLQEIKNLIKSADILITNMLTNKLKKYSLDYNNVKHNKLIYAHLTGYGDNRPGFDAAIQAESGFMFLNRKNSNELPMKMPVALMDILAAHQLKEAILIALLHREKKKEGSYISVSLMSSAITSLANQAYAYLITGIEPQPLGSEHPSIAPYGTVFITKDNKYIQLAVGTDKQFQNLCITLQLNLHLNEKFSTNPQRVKYRNELNSLLANKIKQFTQQEIINKLLNAGVPCAKINSVSEALKLPQAKSIMINNGKGLRQCAFSLSFYKFPNKFQTLPDT